MPSELAQTFAEHLVDSIGSGIITKLPDGRFTTAKPDAEYHDQISDILRNAGLSSPKD